MRPLNRSGVATRSRRARAPRPPGEVGDGKGRVPSAMRPAMPAGIEDRDADVGEPYSRLPTRLAELAEHGAGGRRRHCGRGQGAGTESLEFSSWGLTCGQYLTEAKTEALFTRQALDALYVMEEAPWQDIEGKPLNDRSLAFHLRQYGISRRRLGARMAARRRGTCARTLRTPRAAIFRRCLHP